MIDISQFTALANILGDSPEDRDLLLEMAEEAQQYLEKFKWCPPIKTIHLADGVGGIVALFLVEFSLPVQGEDVCLWTVVGDLPSAYMVTDIESPHEALLEYTLLMDDWAAAVESGGSLDDVFPVDAAPTLDNAHALRLRMKFLRERILPHWRTLHASD